MNAESAKELFEAQLIAAGLKTDYLTVAQGFAAMFAFYRNIRAADCPADAGGDRLLYQWGMTGDNEGDFFELNLTRQFILNGNSEDENIWQLSLTFTFSPNETMRAMVTGNKWCPRPQAKAVDYFEGFVSESQGYLAVAEVDPIKTELDYFNAG
jgi:hypothetical protein